MNSELREALQRTFIVMLKFTNYFNQRTEIFKKSIASLVETTAPTGAKIILIDNGENEEQFCLDLFNNNKIHAYLRLNNLGLVARNIGVDVGCGILPDAEYLVFADDDLIFKPGWLEECVEILLKYPDRKIIASPIHTACHLVSRRLCKGTLPDGHLLNRRAGPNCRVFRVSDFLKIGRFKLPEPENFPANGVEYTNRFVKMKYLSALTYKPMAKDLCARNVRHAYPGPKGKAVVEYLGKSVLNHKVGLLVGSDYQKVQNKNVYGEVGSLMLHTYPDLFLHWVNHYGAPEGLIKQLFKSRVRITQRYHDPYLNDVKFDFIYVETLRIDTLQTVKSHLDAWFPRLNPGGILVCYLPKLTRIKIVDSLLVEHTDYDCTNRALIWKLRNI